MRNSSTTVHGLGLRGQGRVMGVLEVVAVIGSSICISGRLSALLVLANHEVSEQFYLLNQRLELPLSRSKKT